jgi:threonyl-tRNA synthetase
LLFLKSSQGLPLWLPKGAALRERLEHLKKAQKKQVMSSNHPTLVRKNYMLPLVIMPNMEQIVSTNHYPHEGEEFLLKPMNCPHHCEIYNATLVVQRFTKGTLNLVLFTDTNKVVNYTD